MNPPQLPLTIIRERGPRIHHARIVRQQNISTFPIEPQAHPSIIHQPVSHVQNLLIVVLELHLTCRILGFAFRLAFVPA